MRDDYRREDRIREYRRQEYRRDRRIEAAKIAAKDRVRAVEQIKREIEINRLNALIENRGGRHEEKPVSDGVVAPQTANQPSSQPDLNLFFSRQPTNRDLAYYDLCQQYTGKRFKGSSQGVIVARTEDDQIGRTVYAMPEDIWKSTPPEMKEQRAHSKSIVNWQTVRGEIIPAAIIQLVVPSFTSFMVWIDINRPISVIVFNGQGKLVDLRWTFLSRQ